MTTQMTMPIDPDHPLAPTQLDGDVMLRHRPTGVVGYYHKHVRVGDRYNIVVIVEDGGRWGWPVDSEFGRDERGWERL